LKTPHQPSKYVESHVECTLLVRNSEWEKGIA
jgi:hypothetical protein